MKVFIILPAYNEEPALPQLLANLPHKLAGLAYEAVVIDDGSRDRTAAIAAQYPVTLLRHDKNQGLGAALKTGLAYLVGRGRPDDLVLTLDADDTHDPALLFALAEKMTAHDIVIASRYCAGGAQTGVGAVRALLSRLMSGLLQVVFPVKGASDYSSGFRAYRLAVIERGFQVYGDKLIESRGFSCMPELLVKLAGLGARVTEVPLVMHYERKRSSSKFRPLALIGDYLSLFLILLQARIKGQ
ncbi:MAG: glycosyltransferase [Candidatus Margulisbacteria bacterium]|nr:glycosyltransferase [Candidatus Margulisiibacteriota bacterium]